MTQFSIWKDEQLIRVFEESYSLPDAFHRTPKWKRWAVGVISIVFPVIGFGAFLSTLRHTPPMIAALMGLGVAGGVVLVLVLRHERQYAAFRQELTQELLRRGLYEKSHVTFGQPTDR